MAGDAGRQATARAGQRHHRRHDVDHPRGIHQETQRGDEGRRLPGQRPAHHRLSGPHQRHRLRSAAHRLPASLLQQRNSPGSRPDLRTRPRGERPGFRLDGGVQHRGTSHGYHVLQRWPATTWRPHSSPAAQQLDSSDVEMGNGGITGDHDGNAVVLRLDLTVPNAAPTATVTQRQAQCVDRQGHGQGDRQPTPTGTQLTYTGMTTRQGHGHGDADGCVHLHPDRRRPPRRRGERGRGGPEHERHLLDHGQRRFRWCDRGYGDRGRATEERRAVAQVVGEQGADPIGRHRQGHRRGHRCRRGRRHLHRVDPSRGRSRSTRTAPSPTTPTEAARRPGAGQEGHRHRHVHGHRRRRARWGKDRHVKATIAPTDSAPDRRRPHRRGTRGEQRVRRRDR